MQRVLIESPFAANTREGLARNEEYLLAALRESVQRGEAPFASHAFYARFLDDTDPRQRAHGIEAGLNWGKFAEKSVAYVDHGISNGMRAGLARAKKEKRPIEYRRLGVKDPITEAEAEALAEVVKNRPSVGLGIAR